MLSQKSPDATRGFTLIELSVVIVIIGLILAGILVGQNLADRSAVMAVVKDMETYQSAFQQFQEKYQQLPGDMVDAYTYFDTNGTDALCGQTGDATAASGNSNRCNGNGDGIIDGSATSWSYRETLRGWQHMKLAGFITGNFSGEEVGGGNRYQPGTNVPASGDTITTGYNLRRNNPAMILGHYIILAGVRNTTSLDGPALTVPDTVAVDQKLDDGIANGGRLIAEDGSGGPGNCVNAGGSYILDESVSVGNLQCRVSLLVQKLY